MQFNHVIVNWFPPSQLQINLLQCLHKYICRVIDKNSGEYKVQSTEPRVVNVRVSFFYRSNKSGVFLKLVNTMGSATLFTLHKAFHYCTGRRQHVCKVSYFFYSSLYNAPNSSIVVFIHSLMLSCTPYPCNNYLFIFYTQLRTLRHYHLLALSILVFATYSSSDRFETCFKRGFVRAKSFTL